MNYKKIMYYSIAILAAVIVLKLMVAISWKLILFSAIGLGVWLLLDKIIKPQMKRLKLLS